MSWKVSYSEVNPLENRRPDQLAQGRPWDRETGMRPHSPPRQHCRRPIYERVDFKEEEHEMEFPTVLRPLHTYIMVGLIGVAFMLQACMMGPNYTRPETAKADSWRLTTSSAESMANLPWWDLLKDPALQQ